MRHTHTPQEQSASAAATANDENVKAEDVDEGNQYMKDERQERAHSVPQRVALCAYTLLYYG